MVSWSLAGVVILILSGLMFGWVYDQQQEERQAQALFNNLFDSHRGRVPAVLAELIPYQERLADQLMEAAADDSLGIDARMRARLALLKHDPSQIEPIGDWLLSAAPGDLTIALSVIDDGTNALSKKAWDVLEDEEARYADGSSLDSFEREDRGLGAEPGICRDRAMGRPSATHCYAFA